MLGTPQKKAPEKGMFPASLSLTGPLLLACALFAPAVFSAQLCTVASNTTSIPAPIAASQLIYSPTYNRLVLRNSAAIASVNLTTGQSTTHSANANFIDFGLSPSGRYVFGADYGGEIIGAVTPASPSYVHRLDLSSGLWEIKTAYIAGGIQVISDDQFILKTNDQWVWFTNNSWGTGSAVVPLNTQSAPGYGAGVFFGDFRYDANSARLLHGNSNLSSQEIQSFKIIANEFVKQEGTGVYGSAQGAYEFYPTVNDSNGHSVALATDGSVFYYGRLQVDTLDVTRNLRIFAESINSASGSVAYGNGHYFDSQTGDLLGHLGFATKVYALNPDGSDFWAFDSSQNMLRHYTFAAVACPVPSAPIGVAATVTPGTTNIVISWSGVAGATGYNIYMANQPGVTKANHLALGGHSHLNMSSPYTYAAPSSGGNFYIVVTAFNELGEGVESSQVLATLPDTQAPSAPTGLTVTVTYPNRIDVSWNASTDNVGVSHYLVNREGQDVLVYAPMTSLSETYFTTATLYTYSVAACDATNNCSAYSAAVSATGYGAPGPYTFADQTGVAPSTTVTSNTITVSGLTAPAPISITGGEYSINGGPYTSADGTVSSGQTVTVRVMSSALYNSTTTATLTISGLTAQFSVTTHGQPFNSSAYFPLAIGSSWTMRQNGVGGYTSTITGTQVVNGVTISVQSYVYDGTADYWTNDQFGVRLHGGFSPPEFVEECGTVPVTITISPPIVVLPVSGTLGQSVNSSGVMTVDLASCGSFPFGYSATSTIQQLEVVTVAAGTFEAAKVQWSLAIPELGSSGVATQWLAREIGVVKQVDSDGTPWDLESTNIIRTAPDTFSIPPQTGVALNTIVTSSAITVTGTTAASSISITGGQYSINGGAFTSTAGTVTNGQTVAVRQTSSTSPSTTTTATLTIGGVSAPFSVTTLSLPSHLLTVQVTGNGTVTSNPAGINCGATCSAGYLQGTNVTLTAAPGSGTPVFAGWSGGGCTGTGTCTVPMSGPITVTATFVGDTQAPSAPTGLTATAVSGSQINLLWNPATDNVGIAVYPVFRGGIFLATVTAPALVFSDTGLSASTLYSYTVAACDAAGNCSAQSGPASATTLAAGQYAYTPMLELGFNLISNALTTTLDVTATFGNQDAPVGQEGAVTANVVSIWKWNAVEGRWAFYSPALTAAGIASYAASQNYEVLSVIDPGEGYWVNAIVPMMLPAQSGTGFNWNGFNFPALPSGFNLITTADAFTPSQFNLQVSETPPLPGVIPTDNFVSLWAWDALAGTWYFYSPLLEASGGLPAVKAYADSHFFRHFQDYGKVLGLGTGFWVNRP